MTTRENLQRQFFDMLMESQFWSPEALRDYQRSQLAQLLRHARANVPFYQHRLDAVVKPNGDIDWDRWGEIPIVRRQDLVEHREAMQATELPKGHGPTAVFETSGSTGLPIKRTATSVGTIANNALRWRVQRWHDLDWGKTLCTRLGNSQHAIDWPDGQALGFWGPAWDDRARQGGTWQISRDLPSEYLFRFFVEHRCSYLNAGPNMAHVNALDAERLGIELKIEAILAQGSAVRQANRDICRRVFGAKMIEHYSSKEGGQMAHPCPAGVLHVNSETCLIEVLDDQNRPVGPGKSGRVIVTPFFETAQPLLRYEQGDVAIVGEPCACGRHTPTLKTVAGRSGAIFTHPDGRSVIDFFPDNTAELLNCEFWQFAQVGPRDFEMRYLPRAGGGSPNEQEVLHLFRKIYFSDADLRFVRSPDIVPTQAGKLVEYRNEWQTVN